MEHVFSKQVGQYLLQAIPLPGLYTPIGAMGMFWEGQITMDLEDTKFLDNKHMILRTSESYSTPEAALTAAEYDIPKYVEKMKRKHIRDYNEAIMPLDKFEEQKEKSTALDVCFEVVSIEDYKNGDFYTDDGEYKAYLVYKGNVLWFAEYDDWYEDRSTEFLRDDKMTFKEFACLAFDCEWEDIQNVLIVDYPECK